jgi:hypothetical protein
LIQKQLHHSTAKEGISHAAFQESNNQVNQA